jgi:hypothetical protein
MEESSSTASGDDDDDAILNAADGLEDNLRDEEDKIDRKEFDPLLDRVDRRKKAVDVSNTESFAAVRKNNGREMIIISEISRLSVLLDKSAIDDRRFRMKELQTPTDGMIVIMMYVSTACVRNFSFCQLHKILNLNFHSNESIDQSGALQSIPATWGKFAAEFETPKDALRATSTTIDHRQQKPRLTPQSISHQR